MTSRGPVSLRDTLGLLTFYRREVGLSPIFEAAGGENWDPRQIYYAIHGRRPDSLGIVLNDRGNTAYNIFTGAMFSEEFRTLHPPRILREYPEKRRLFFVHIPKSAGSDLSSHLTSRYPTLNTRLCLRDWATNEEFLQALKDFTHEVQHSDTIYVTGHNHLSLYESWNVLRYEDRIFTVLREPVAQVISQVNYVLTRIFSTADVSAPDTRGWRKLFGVDDLSIEHSPEALRKLCTRILADPGVTGRNIACTYLGGSYEKAIERIATHDVEMVDLLTYDRWCKEQWGITNSRHVNAAKKYFTRADFSSSDMDYIMALNDQDRLLYADLAAALAKSGAASAQGIELARESRAAAARLAPIVPDEAPPTASKSAPVQAMGKAPAQLEKAS